MIRENSKLSPISVTTPCTTPSDSRKFYAKTYMRNYYLPLAQPHQIRENSMLRPI